MNDPTLKTTVCPQCGTPAAPAEGFCRNCGKQLFAPTMTAPPPDIPPLQAHGQARSQAPYTATAPPKKRRSKLMMGCLIFVGLIVVATGAGGIYVWRATAYTPPPRKAPEIPGRAGGTLTEFPVDNDPNAPARPTSVLTESLGGATAKTEGSSSTKLPPGIDRSKLSKGATTMTSATYKPQPKTQQPPSSGAAKDEIYICVLVAMPNQPSFVDELTSSITVATSGQQTGVRVQSPKGPIYVGTSIRSPQGKIYVLKKQSDDILILIYSPDPAMESVVDRLAQNVNNGEGLNDYPETKSALWTLPASTPSDLTLVEISTMTGGQIANSISSGGDIPSEMSAFIPDRLTTSKYIDSGRKEWVALNLEYGSGFQAWRTWLLARGVLGLSGAESTTVRDVNGSYLTQDGQRILVFQKGPYLVFLSGPSGATLERLVALGNQIQV